MILDACRDNPFAGEGSRSIGSSRGLARVEPPKGSLVIYSAGVGERALDNLGEDDPSPNSLFTRTLLRQMDEEGLEVRDLVRRMRNEVREAALRAGGHSQTPGYYNELLDSFFFPPKSATDPNVASCERNADPEADSLPVMRRNLEPVFGDCLRAMRAKPGDERLRNLFLAVAEQRAFQSALGSDAPDAASNYLAHYPAGRYAADVVRHLARLERGRTEPTIDASEPARVEWRIETAAQPSAPSGAVPAPAVAVAALTTKVETAPPAIPGAPVTGAPVPSPAAPEPPEDEREALARQLQDELKRVGCYAGPTDGAWGVRAREALVAFNRAAGAGLPPDDPRRASVEAVRLHAAQVCLSSAGSDSAPTRTASAACASLAGWASGSTMPESAPLGRLSAGLPCLRLGSRVPSRVRSRRAPLAPSPPPFARRSARRPCRGPQRARSVRRPLLPGRPRPRCGGVQRRAVPEPPPAPRLVRRPDATPRLAAPPRQQVQPRVVAEPAPRLARRPAAPPHRRATARGRPTGAPAAAGSPARHRPGLRRRTLGYRGDRVGF
jgi:hypothetical protein